VRREAAGVAAARRRVVTGDEPQAPVAVEVDVAGDVAAGSAVVRDAQDLLPVLRSRCAGPPGVASTNLNRDS
jgi:hypothetical protein